MDASFEHKGQRLGRLPLKSADTGGFRGVPLLLLFNTHAGVATACILSPAIDFFVNLPMTLFTYECAEKKFPDDFCRMPPLIDGIVDFECLGVWIDVMPVEAEGGMVPAQAFAPLTLLPQKIFKGLHEVTQILPSLCRPLAHIIRHS